MRRWFAAYDGALLPDDMIEVPVQINGKVRARIKIAADASQKQLSAAAKEAAKDALAGRTIKKAIVVPGRLVNLVT